MEPDFDDAAPTLDGVADLTDVEQDNAVEFVDRTWYRDVVKRGRWMDLIGDYAGTERFILDGEALLQEVLDDKLLAIGVKGEPSFQLAHALHSMERLLDSMLSRGAVFDVVFFAQTRHLTLQKRGSEFVHASRALARTLLFNHLAQHAGKIGLAVYTFPDLADPGWKEYRRRARPMFIMTNDGGEAKRKQDLTARDRCTLVQRMFIIHVLISEGIAVTLLRGAEFRDMKIFSFVFEQRYNPKARFPPGLLSAFQAALQSLEAADSSKGGAYALKMAQSERPRPLDDILVDLITRVNSSSEHERLHSHSLLWLFSLHCVLLPTLSLGQRARKLDPLHGDLSEELTSHFLPSLFRALSSTLLAHNDSIDVDGRLFVSLVTFTIAHSNSTLESLIGSDVYARGRSIWKTAGLGDPPPLVSFCSSYPQPSQAPVASTAMVPRLALMPFQNAVFDQELSSIQVSVDSAPTALEPLEFALGVAFEDDRHWHAHKRSILPKHLGGEAPQTTTEKQRRKVLKAEQRFMTSMQRLAATLTGASGGSLQQIVISPAGTKSRATQKQLPSSSAPKQQQKKGKAPVLSSADKIRVKKAEADMAKADAADGEWWAAQQTQLAVLSSTPDKLEFLQRLSRNQRTQSRWLAVEIQMYRLDLEIAEWIADPDAENANVRDRHTVSLLRQVKDIYAITGAHPACVPILESILTSLGFSSLIPSLSTISVPPNARPLSFKFTKLLRSKSGKPAHKFMKITEHPIHWQLRLFGEYMDRSMDGQPDKRVSFHPDAWQKRVLDCLDRKNCSLLVVAPTSAGKTFISFYAMEKLLKESDTDILVYVSPTKALVNQVAAEVYARFSKDLNGRSCWAVHTRDYRIHDPQKCQILVTVPEMLAVMLLSPPLANTWTPRIKRIILDEIHTIGQHEGGSVWEQILLLAPCPIIGLSATVGEPEAFNNWLASVQEAKGFEHEFILHPHRYSHLRKYAYFPQLLRGHKNEQMFSGLDSVKSTGIKRFIHPMTALSFNTTSLPSDLSLEASDVLTLYTAISALHPEALKADVSTLDPTVFFSETKLLTQKDILAYESVLKQALEPLFSSSNSLDPDTALKTVVDSLMDSAIAKTDPSLLNAPPSKAAIRTKLLSLLTDLHAEGDLPALLFNFDRNDCEQMLTSVTDSLEKAEKLWRSSSPEWKRKIQAYERWKAGAKERQRRAEKLKSMKKSADDEPAPVEDQSWESSFDPDEPSPQFCFIGNTGFSRSDLEKEIDYLRWRGVPVWALNGLRRGIAVHHSGMNRAYRSLVERLFRLKFLQVVIATGTLALGINAPTKTSVFCGDSPFLTALMYRQCAGRAGRRGYDTLGKVVFYGIPLDRIYRLMLSKLPRLAGTFPLSSTLSLRLFNLLHGSHYSTFAKDAIRSILQLPQISFGSSVGRDQLLHHLRFSIDYLRRAQLLDQEGQPINLFGMASHLYYTEPSNFALVALLQKGVIHDICERHNGIKAQHEIVLLMAHLFGRRYLPTVYTGGDALQEITRKYPSVVVLPPMRQEAAAVLSQHQERILQIFTTYAVTYCEQYRPELEADDVLPLSGIQYGTLVETSPFHDHLGSSAQDITARSVFVGNSGHADHFTSISELANTARRGLHLNEHAIPSFEQLLGARGKAHSLNAYLLDFYTHGQTVTLANANGIRPGEVWFVLQDFELTLKTVRGNLENLLLRSAVTAEAADDETTDVDSGYFTQDVTEIDAEDEAVEGKRVRPPGVSDRDWRVLEVFDEVVNVFSEKFRAMWA